MAAKKARGPSRPEYRQESENRPRAGVTPEELNDPDGDKPFDGNALEPGPRYGDTGVSGAEELRTMESDKDKELGQAPEAGARAVCRYCRTELVWGERDRLPWCPGCGMVAVDSVALSREPRTNRVKKCAEGGRGEEGGTVLLGAPCAAPSPMTPEEREVAQRLMDHMLAVSDKVNRAVLKGLARARKGRPGERLALVGATYGALVFEAEVLKAYVLQDLVDAGGSDEGARSIMGMGELLARTAFNDDRARAEREDQGAKL